MAESSDREAELAALHRSYRMMETDRQRYNEESQNIIKRQRQASSLPGFPCSQIQEHSHEALHDPQPFPHLLAARGLCGLVSVHKE